LVCILLGSTETISVLRDATHVLRYVDIAVPNEPVAFISNVHVQILKVKTTGSSEKFVAVRQTHSRSNSRAMFESQGDCIF
jgi:hypothetical protein